MLTFGLLYGLILVGGGIHSLLSAFNKKKKIDAGIHHEFFSIITILCGCTGIAGYFLHSDFGLWTCLFFLTGVLLIWAPFYERKLIKTCSTAIEAKCIRYNKCHASRGQTSHAPIFEYNYLDTVYTTQTPVGYLSEKNFRKNI